ncbi:MAG: GatB/YqeY domain-containing protein [Pseudomonadales bacterium]|nr:GatB/YqeY domain-containing protein [Pseudomonadales bacterium]
MSSEIKSRIDNDVKDAMRARDKQRLGTLRLITAELKRVEVDERIELDDTRVLAILDKMSKQRKDSLAQYEQAGRQDLADQESFELDVIKEYMPSAMSEAELEAAVAGAIASTGASTMKDMGQVMAALRPAVQGRADMGAVSNLVKQRLSGA